MEIENKKNFLINFLYLSVIGALIFLASNFLINYLLPFIVALIIAFLMQKPARFLGEKSALDKGMIAAIFSVLVYFIFAFVVIFLIYKITGFFGGLTKVLPDLFEEMSSIANVLHNRFSSIMPDEFSSAFDGLSKSIFERIAASVSGFVSQSLTKVAKIMPSFLFSSIVALVASCYIAKDYDRLLRFIKELCGKKVTANLEKIKVILFESVFKLIKGYLILTVLTYLQLLTGFLILKVEHAPIIALLISFVDVLPVLGTGTILIPWAVLSVFFGNIRLAIGLGILYIVVVIVRNFAEPKIIGTQIGINPLFTLLAMFVGLKIFGVAGLFLFPIILIVVIKYYKNQMQEGLSV